MSEVGSVLPDAETNAVFTWKLNKMDMAAINNTSTHNLLHEPRVQPQYNSKCATEKANRETLQMGNEKVQCCTERLQDER